MRSVKKIATNVSLLSLAQIISYIFSFFFYSLTARYLGAGNFGILSFALAFTGIFSIISDIGLQKIITRDVARNKDLTSIYLGNLASLKLILAPAALFLVIIFVNLLGYPQDTKIIVYIIGLSATFNAISQFYYAFFQAYEKMIYESIGRILNSLMLLSGALVLLNYGFSVKAFAVLYLLVSFIIFIYCLITSLVNFGFFSLRINRTFLRNVISESLPFALLGVFEMIYHWIDTVMLSLMQGDSPVGWYNAAYRIFMVTLFIPIAVNSSVYPVMSRFFVSSIDNLKLIQEKYFKFMSFIAVFIGIGTTLFAKEIILMVFGQSYSPSIIALQILIWSAVLIYINGAFVQLFQSSNRQKTVTKVAGIAAVFNIVLNLILIPKYSYIGASIATVISELIIFICMISLAFKTSYINRPSFFIIQFGKVLFAGIITGLIGYVLSDYNVFMVISSLALIYLLLFYLIRGFDKDELLLIKQVIS